MAMAGMIPLSGFFAKDEILVAAKAYSTPVLILILLTLPVTALYMMRLYMLTFLGRPLWSLAHVPPTHRDADVAHQDVEAHVVEHDAHEPHEMGLVIWGPLVLLAGLTLVGWLRGLRRPSARRLGLARASPASLTTC